MRVEPRDGFSPLLRGESNTRAFLSTTRGRSKKAAICAPGRESSPELNGAGALVSDSRPPEL